MSKNKECCSQKGDIDTSLATVAKNMKKRGFEVSEVSTLHEAAQLVIDTILPASKAKSVAFGGSVTIEESKLVERLQESPQLEVLNTYDRSIGEEAFIERRRQALLVDAFLCSANAVSADGRLFYRDNFGNRTAAVQFGPKKVILLVGKNKIAGDAHAAMHRLKNVASPANCKRFGKNTPCVTTGECSDCASPERICSVTVIQERSFPKGRVHVILIDEEIGF